MSLELNNKSELPEGKSSQKNQGMIVVMVDGFDMAYYRQTDLPVMQRMAREGFFKSGSAIFPSLTNANNISIACGAWPERHGVTTNCYFDPQTGQAHFLEDASFLASETMFQRGARAGVESVLLTCKSKTTKIMGQDATLAIAAEDPPPEIRQRFGDPPPMYSAEINYWLFEVALDLLKTMDRLKLIYIHTTDYPMHMWPPEAPESQEHLQKLDAYLGRLMEGAPDFCLALTADHGMNRKTRCWDLTKACRNRGAAVQFAVSPVADRLVKHHRGFGGVSYVYLEHPEDVQQVSQVIAGLEGVEEVLNREQAAHRFSLMAERIGDLVVLPDIDTVFGDLSEECETLAAEYRSHGSLYEMDIPLLIYNYRGLLPRYREINYNIDVTRFLLDRYF